MRWMIFSAFMLAPLATAEAAPPTLGLPSRPAGATGGRAFAASIVGASLREREERIAYEVISGNVPSFLRTLAPVTLARGRDRATVFVTADYLAVGSADDYFLAPMTPRTAQSIADRLGCVLPTPRIVDATYRAAKVKLPPSPIPPTPAMTTVPVFLAHNETVTDQRAQAAPTGLVAGHKKDVVVANKAFEKSARVAIYGWHRPDGRPIQPLYAGHAETWVDYSHGVRLVSAVAKLNGEDVPIETILRHPTLAPLLSDEGAMPRVRYAMAVIREELRLDPGVRVVIDRPMVPRGGPTLLLFYGLPNGNEVEWTIGKPPAQGQDWRYDIQHVGAQTQFLRDAIRDRDLVVVYLANDLKSWPAWRKTNGDSMIPGLFDQIRKRFPELSTRAILSGHSGGGSLIFGLIEATDRVPDWVERIAFLDANYAYDGGRHLGKLTQWLGGDDHRRLIVLAYDDASALLNGKPFVSREGGTWGRSLRMIDDLGKTRHFQVTTAEGLRRVSALDGRALFLLKENPDRKILHTVQVERNGLIECVLSGTDREGVGYRYLGERAYAPFVRSDAAAP